MEQWKPIPGYEGLYEVSDQGRVRSLDRITTTIVKRLGKMLKPQLSSGRMHLTVSLSLNGKVSVKYVHQLVALAFHGVPEEGQQVRHLNGVPTDNVLENLKYGTHVENSQDMILHGRHWSQKKTHCPRQHLLVVPNLVIGERQARGPGTVRACRACGNARSYERNHQRRGIPLPPNWNREDYADARYQKIMGELLANST
jgi:hypothetical protein